MTPNRLVALATPLAAPLAGWLAAWIATHFPGLNIPQNAIEEIFIAGSLFAVAPAAQWLHGWQKWEAQQAHTEEVVTLATIDAAAEPTVEMNFEAEDAFDAEDDFDSFADLDDFEDFDEFEDELFADEEPAPLGS